MHFSVTAGDGTFTRKAQAIKFVHSAGVTHTLTAKYEGLMIESPTGVEVFDDVNEAAVWVAALLHRCSDQSVVIAAGSGYTTRGDEDKTADVYPPHRHPRINVQG